MSGKFLTGFTLVEILIYLALVSLVAVGFIQFALTVSSVGTTARIESRAVEELRFAAAAVENRIRSADAIDVDASVFGGDPGLLALRMDDASLDPTVIDLDSDDGRLRIAEGARAPRFLTGEDVSVTEFSVADATATSTREHVRVTITVENALSAASAEFGFKNTIIISAGVRQ